MGWESATERQRLQTLLYFRKIVIMDPNRICYKVLREMESDFDSRSWLGKVRPLLVELNLESNILVNCSHEEAKYIIRYRLSDLVYFTLLYLSYLYWDTQLARGYFSWGPVVMFRN